jgi:flavin reductase (DIM6/NTAB) family NADH-FMN oxidoreductase RutF
MPADSRDSAHLPRNRAGMDVVPDDLAWPDAYALLVGAVQPRPIAWVATRDAAGVRNLAPFSFFMGVCGKPLTIAFAPMAREDGPHGKDTLRNLVAVPECVVNVVNEPLAARMNATAAQVGPEVDEFELAGLTPVASRYVSVPRVGESPVAFACRVGHIHTVSSEPGGGSIVVLTVVGIHIDDAVLDAKGRISTAKLLPIGRLAGAEYARTTDRFSLIRPA